MSSLDVHLTAIGHKYPAFKGLTLGNHQVKVIESVLDRRYTFASLGTGCRKSLTYLLPPLILDQVHGGGHTALVISPLQEFLHQQVKQIQAQGMSAVALTADMSEADTSALYGGQVQVILATPELTTRRDVRDGLRSLYKQRLAVIAVDRLHYITSWSDTFMDKYGRLPQLSSVLDVPWLFLTATATQEVQDEILDLFYMQGATRVAMIPDRPEIQLSFRPCPHNIDILSSLYEELRTEGHRMRKTLVFTTTMDDAGRLYEKAIVELGLACYYKERRASKRMVSMNHSRITGDTGRFIRETFNQPDSVIRLLFSTAELGIVYHVQDIERVVMFGVPATISELWQQVGCCARGPGRTGSAVVYLTSSTVAKADKYINHINNTFHDQCQRSLVLQPFNICGVGEVFSAAPGGTTGCEGGCTLPCCCGLCSCCDSCSSKCTCPTASTDTLALHMAAVNMLTEDSEGSDTDW